MSTANPPDHNEDNFELKGDQYNIVQGMIDESGRRNIPLPTVHFLMDTPSGSRFLCPGGVQRARDINEGGWGDYAGRRCKRCIERGLNNCMFYKKPEWGNACGNCQALDKNCVDGERIKVEIHDDEGTTQEADHSAEAQEPPA